MVKTQEKPGVNSYVAVDIETTGLSRKTETIIEIGAVLVAEGQIQKEFSSLVNPGRPLEEETISLTGITNAMTAEAPDLEPVIKAFLEFSGELPLLGHRILFDYGFLKQAAANAGVKWERSGIDTLKLCRKLMPADTKKNLTDACRFFGIQREGCHRALWDAKDAHFLYQALRRRFDLGKEKSFLPEPLICRVKRDQPASKRQKERLQELLKYHKIEAPVQLDSLTRSQASRLTDQIIGTYGKNR